VCVLCLGVIGRVVTLALPKLVCVSSFVTRHSCAYKERTIPKMKCRRFLPNLTIYFMILKYYYILADFLLGRNRRTVPDLLDKKRREKITPFAL
jgi:hypothetical protein